MNMCKWMLQNEFKKSNVYSAGESSLSSLSDFAGDLVFDRLLELN